MKTTKEVFRSVLKELGFERHKPSQMSNSDYWMCTETAMKKYAEQFHRHRVEGVTDEMIWKKYLYYHNDDKREGAIWLKDELLKK